MANKLGIKELAERLDISIASVSRALHNPDRVSAKMRDKVQLAAKELGYKPNTLASSLRTAKTNNLVAIIPDLSDTFNAGVIRSMEDTATSRGYSILFGDSQGQRERELRYGEHIQSKRADGVIFFSAIPPFEEELLQSDNFTLPPMVNSCEVIAENGYMIKGKSIPYVTIDNVAAAKEVTEHLIAQGHERIAIITGDPKAPSAQLRLQGYKNAHVDNSIAIDNQLIFEGLYTIESGQQLAADILAMENPPSAIFCMCDESAIGCMQTLKEHGKRIPEDIAVTGFDNIRFSQFSSPSITTIAQPVKEIGQRCINLLIDIIEKKNIKEQHIVLPHKLIIRDSTKVQ